MYTQEIVCPQCARFTAVNVVDTAGTINTPCSQCDARIEVIITKDGKVHDIRLSGNDVNWFVAVFSDVESPEGLNDAMREEGYSECITLEGHKYRLPSGTYILEGDRQLTMDEAFDRACNGSFGGSRDGLFILFRYNRAKWFLDSERSQRASK